jgi:mRNA interferase MazF
MADLDPPRGTEPGKIRPVLVLQSDALNSTHPSTIALPITTKVRLESRILRVHLKKGEAGLNADSDVMVDQLRSIDNRRIRRALGAAPKRCLEQIERNVALILDLSISASE